VSQIKKTYTFLHSYSKISIVNAKGHTKNIVEAKFEAIKSIIIYAPNEDLMSRNDIKNFMRVNK